MQRNRRWIMAAAALAFLAVSPAQADVKAGVDAWQAGNYAGAIAEWRPLAEKGDPDAQFNMGQAYKLGRGVPTDLKLAQTWYEKAAQQGHEQAQANLGLILFQNGERAAAMPWISKASDHGDPRAQYVLGTALFNGDLVAKDWPRAYALMTRAAAQGLPQAAGSLTEMDKYIPLQDRQKGIELARAMERGGAVLAQSAPAQAKPAVPAAGPKPVSVPASKVPVPTAKPAAPTTKPAPPTAKATAPTIKATSTPAAVKPPVQTAAPGGKWRVQLGAFGSPQIARSQWTAISRKVGALAGLQPFYEPAGALTRLRVGPLASRAAADRVCAGAKASGQACFVVAP